MLGSRRRLDPPLSQPGSGGRSVPGPKWWIVVGENRAHLRKENVMFNKDMAAFVIACFIRDLARWADDYFDQNLAEARALADDLGIRNKMEVELRHLGGVPTASEVTE